VASPIIRQIKDSRDALDYFESVSLQTEDEKTQDIIMRFPTVYIHNWKESDDFEVYVGESNDVMVYCQNLADKLGVDPDEIINKKMDQNEDKYPVEKAKGSSTKYNEL
jgi:hypothetical protein